MDSNIVGKSMKELTQEEMESIYGGNGADAETRSTPVCTLGISFLGSYLGSAATKCGKANKK
ncbi:lichenicidin A2 family type 2 lantibiotic [Staphylococcus hominis]|uniref:lichenicidin A2 family type 2 lantibiotic n=1 Tax=Staphylococcus hominis TaxID=1290 RepID=UPI00287AD271|nr:lichenicidin A2 family type 2 lantibiotic [Staphylococcus hominis]MDS3918862.1 lichenicidin A2 family type 2 lantibiotic [Staphylococcus hominis]